jgi:tartrate-resistant acid phosphatase type 5
MGDKFMTPSKGVLFSKKVCFTIFSILALEILPIFYTQAQTVFAVIGDFGTNDSHEQGVATLVDSWNPAYIITVGDNVQQLTYPYSEDVGKYYHKYLFPHDPIYGSSDTQTSNHFWPAVGNWDWNMNNLQDYLSYFELPNNERYYNKRIGDIEFFFIDSDSHEPDGTSSTSAQAQWVEQQILNSTARWKIVLFHHPAYSSGGSYSGMRWPFEDWGVDAVMSGHVHSYERILRDDNNDGKNIVYFANAMGGKYGGTFGSTVSGSQAQYNASPGALKVTENNSTLRFQFYNTSGTLIDAYTLDKSSTTNHPPVTASNPSPANNATGISLSPTLSWSCSDPDGDALTYDVYFSTSSNPTTKVSTGQSAKTLSRSGLSSGATYYWKIVAMDSKGATTDGPVWSFTTTSPTPVELTAFSAKLISNFTVQLSWSTATEVNNYGFDVERSSESSGWQKIGFVAGAGNSNSPKEYSFTDNPSGGTSFSYRLKQIDVGGVFKYYDPVSISLAALDEPQLLQNNPNPFNPSTAIKFYIPNASNVTIKIYNILGREIKTLIDEQTAAGYHVVYWNGKNGRGEVVSSGIYLYRLTAGEFSQAKKMNMLK